MRLRFISILLLSWILTSRAHAEYNGYHIHFIIKTTNGHVINAYTYLGEDYISKDSLDNQTYLKTVLNFSFNVKEGEFNYCTRRKSFCYPVPGETEQDTQFVNLYSISCIKSISISSIQEIKILEMLDQGTGISIYNPAMIRLCKNNQRPILEIQHAGGYLCEYDIIIYRKSNKLARIFKKLDVLGKSFEETTDASEEGQEPENDYKKGDELDRQVELLIRKIRKKAIIIQSCTC